MDDIEWLHIHGPAVWHDDAYIVGNRAGLEALRDAINVALSKGQSGTTSTRGFTGDGEGFDLYISLAAGDPSAWRRPYSDECAWDCRQDAIDPFTRAQTDLAAQAPE